MKEASKIKLYTKEIRYLNQHEYQSCYSLNMRERGDMRYRLSWERRPRNAHGESKAIMAWDGLKLVGWALIFRDGSKTSVYTYVRQKYRRQGIGTKLLKRTLRNRKSVVAVYGHDARSVKFYEQFVESGKAINYW